MSEALDMIAPHFRRLADRWPDAPTLSSHYQDVATSYEGNQHGLVETAKSFVECVCHTILWEYGKKMESDSQTSTLLTKALQLLGLENTRGAGELGEVLKAHNRLADALSYMRNNNTPVAHGKDGFLDTLTKNHIRTYLLTADTLLAILLAAFEGTDPHLLYTRESYDNFRNQHDRIDGSVTAVDSSLEYVGDSPVVVITVKTESLPDDIELRVEPSRLLFSVDRQHYVNALNASTVQTTVTAEGSKAEEVPVASSVEPNEVEPPSEIVHDYEGHLLPLANDLRCYVDSLKLPISTRLSSGENIIDSLLATAEANMGTDWREREALQIRMNIALRRTLNRFGCHDDAVAKNGAKFLAKWFTNRPDLPNGEGGA